MPIATAIHGSDTWMPRWISEGVLNEIYQRKNLLYGSHIDRKAHESHLEKIQRFVWQGKPIQLVLPAFPAKSPNRQKTLSHLPDFGEVLALRALNDLCHAIARWHAPGAEVVICSDGRVFGNLVQITDEDVNDYGTEIECIIESENLGHLRTFHLEHFFGEMSFDEMRSQLEKRFAVSVDEVRARVKEDHSARLLFGGIHRFLFEDRLAMEKHKSRNQVREEAKEVAYQVIQRSNAWSSLVEKCFPEALRLSIHPQASDSAKIGVRLLASGNQWTTPWHGVAVLKDGRAQLMKRAEAELLGARLHKAEGKYACFLA